MLQGEHSAILSSFIKLLFVINVFVLSIFEWPFYTGFAIFVEDNFSSLPAGSDFLSAYLSFANSFDPDQT